MTTRSNEIISATFPRTYSLSRDAWRFMVTVGLLVMVLGVAGSIYIGLHTDDPIKGRVVGGTLCGAFAILGLLLLLNVRRYQVILGAGYIEVVELFGRRRLERINILGRRHFQSNAGTGRWILIPERGFGRKLELSMFLATDADFVTWVLSLPDLDSDRKDTEAKDLSNAVAVLKERGYGEGDQARLRRAAVWAYRGAYGLAIAIFLIPDPHHVFVWTAVALPWLGIGAVAKFAPFYRFGGPRNSPLPDLSPLLFLPGLFLVLKVLRSISIVDWHSALALTLIGAFAVMGAAFYVDRWLRKHLGTAMLLLLLCCSYGYGAGIEVNALLDHARPTIYPVAVLSKHISRGKSTSYYIAVSPWGPHPAGDDVMVSPGRYRSTGVGDRMCVLLKPGVFMVGWFVLDFCHDEPY
jgi:hypothetical protein